MNNKNFKWDVTINDEIEYFDPTLSYELTGYRPIDEERGLDFKPEWFTEAAQFKIKENVYCLHPPGSRLYRDFWTEEYRRCKHGYTVNGYTLTGDHYFFLNFYILKGMGVSKAGGGRTIEFPSFFSKQYEYFHYVELCERLGCDSIALKSRGVGFSEIAASLGVRPYTTTKNYNVLYTAFKSHFLDKLLEKCWFQLDNLNNNTEGGMRRVRQKLNNKREKRASIVSRSGEERGRMSQITGIVADKPENVRGDRLDRLFFEEAGSDKVLMTKYIQSRPLVEIQGNKVGTRFVWGTGGDMGEGVAGLSELFYNPAAYGGLPYRHNHTQSGEFVLTGFFIPSYTFVAKKGYIDERGVTNTAKAKEYYNKKFDLLSKTPQAYLKEKAEFCFTPEDALSLEGDNIFNAEILGQQMANIKLHKLGPKIDVGNLEYVFKDNKHIEEARSGVKFVEDMKGKIKIYEHPLKENGEIPLNLYVAGIDGIDIGQQDTSEFTKNASDFCVVVKRRQHGLKDPTIVCIYKDRPERIIEAHRITLKILEYYNCMAVMEHTRVSLLQFFRTRGIENKYLMRRPAACQANPNVRRKNVPFGAQATDKIIKHYLNRIAEMIEIYGHGLWFEELIEEASKYSIQNKTDFDIIAAWGMAELGDEELMNTSIKTPSKTTETFNIGYYTDSNGNKRFGNIPTGNMYQANVSSYFNRPNYDEY